MVSGYCDVDYRAGGDVCGEEDGGEFDLRLYCCQLLKCAGVDSGLGWTYYSFVLGEKDSHAGIDLADGEGDEHCDYCGCVVVVEDSWCCCQTSVREPRRKWTGVR